MPQPITLPRRPLSEPEDEQARRQINRWKEQQDAQPHNGKKRPITFNSAA